MNHCYELREDIWVCVGCGSRVMSDEFSEGDQYGNCDPLFVSKFWRSERLRPSVHRHLKRLRDLYQEHLTDKKRARIIRSSS